MLRTVLCALLVGASLFIGYYLSTRLKRRTRLLEDFIVLFNNVRLRIAYTGDSLAEIFTDNFAARPFDPYEPFTLQWDEFVDGYSDTLDAEDIRVLRAFADGLGESDSASQQQHIKLYITMLEERLKTARAEIEKKAKIYRAVPFFFGLALAIILL